MSSKGDAPPAHPRRLSCSTCFDALWFCYTPVHQVQQYYRVGTIDTCKEQWSALIDCLTLKTKRDSEMQVRLFLNFPIL
uniref:Uncharacterized protein n=1 Tax=Rhizophora mucronata TaxID=61149 RepID=A0A2P2NI11_RHIMU